MVRTIIHGAKIGGEGSKWGSAYRSNFHLIGGGGQSGQATGFTATL